MVLTFGAETTLVVGGVTIKVQPLMPAALKEKYTGLLMMQAGFTGVGATTFLTTTAGFLTTVTAFLTTAFFTTVTFFLTAVLAVVVLAQMVSVPAEMVEPLLITPLDAMAIQAALAGLVGANTVAKSRATTAIFFMAKK